MAEVASTAWVGAETATVVTEMVAAEGEGWTVATRVPRVSLEATLEWVATLALAVAKAAAAAVVAVAVVVAEGVVNVAKGAATVATAEAEANECPRCRHPRSRESLQ